MRNILSFLFYIAAATMAFQCERPVPAAAAEVTMRGSLRVHPQNPRYFTDDSGRAILLTGSHTWNNLVDMGPADPPARFDYDAYLDWLAAYPHNFFRLWTWELLSWDTSANRESKATLHYAAPQPWQRTGPGQALDNKPKFNLQQFNPEYFDRLRWRVNAAREHGIYAAVMLFEGWGVQFIAVGWASHPFHPQNNVNDINGDRNGDGVGVEIHELLDLRITALQEAYVRKVIDTVNEFDNVLYEISNENHPASTPWQHHFIRFVQDYEKTKPKRHPVGMTFQYKAGSNQTLFDSPADWISPNHEGGYRDNPPPADGAKVILTDTDHLWGIGGNPAWVWKSFLRGLNPVFMDPFDGRILSKGSDPKWAEAIRKSMGYALQWSRRIDLTAMTPRAGLASSKYCLANPGRAYLAYLPDGKETTLDLSAAAQSFAVEWFNPESGETRKDEPVQGGGSLPFTSPFQSKDAVLYLQRAPQSLAEVTVRDAAGLREAVARAKPGTCILLAAGDYPGGFHFSSLRGEAGQPIVIAAADPSHPPVIIGGATGMHLTDPAYLELRDLTFRGGAVNGLNIDDGGSFETPAQHILLRGLQVTDVGARGQGQCLA
ncbi:MAG: DUF6298 domain-containing protein [Verrucomicrobiota bacterium]